ncbi:MAG: hypothetical protein K5857_03395 [Lachnospiraceae bacterium]|nr:hypothetical protein [Lachnospiraceae bacterium]
MGLLTSTVSREIGRIEYMIKKYEQIRSTLPKGTICEKRLGKKDYYYLKYRDGDRIVSDYVHKEDLENLRELVEHRKHVEIMIRSLKDELKTAKKLMGGRIK